MSDLISRQAAIDAIRATDDYTNVAIAIGLGRAMNAVGQLPSAQKTGRWIHGREVAREMVGDVITAIFYEGWECSECHCLVEDEREPLWQYCPNCGCRMMEVEHETD